MVPGSMWLLFYLDYRHLLKAWQTGRQLVWQTNLPNGRILYDHPHQSKSYSLTCKGSTMVKPQPKQLASLYTPTWGRKQVNRKTSFQTDENWRIGSLRCLQIVRQLRIRPWICKQCSWSSKNCEYFWKFLNVLKMYYNWHIYEQISQECKSQIVVIHGFINVQGELQHLLYIDVCTLQVEMKMVFLLNKF